MAANGCAPRRVLAGWLGLAMAGCAEPQHFVRTGGPAAEPLVGTTAAAEVAPRPVGCAEALGALGRTAGGAAAGDGSGPAGLALLEEPGRPAAALRIDLAVPVVRRPAEVSTGCLLLVEIEAQPAERRVLGRERVWSEREVSIERRPNPEYELARRELARLADRLDREDREQARDLKRLAPTGNALVDALGLVGGLVLGGIGSFARDREFEEARARLESIPRWIEESRSEPYQVTVAETELVRRATVRLALVEPDGRRYWATVAPLVRTDRLRVAVDPHPRDRGRFAGEGRLATPADLEALASAPPPVTLSELLPRLAALVGEPGRPGGPAEARFAWANAPAPQLAAATPPVAPADVGAAATPARSPAAAGRPAPPLPASDEGTARPPASVDPSEIALGPVAAATGRPGAAAEARFAWANAPAPRLAAATPPVAPADVGAAATPARSPAATGRPVPPLPASDEGTARPPASVDPSEIALGPVAVATGRTDGAAEARFAWANSPAPRLAGASPAVAPTDVGAAATPARSPAAAGRQAPPLPASDEGTARPPASVDPSEIALGPVAVATGRTDGAAEARFAWANAPAPWLAAASPAVAPVEAGRGGRREASGAPAGAAEATAALVRVQGPGGEAHGFYLARDKIVTLGRVLGGSSLARIETADGFTTWGVVERERPGSELLLLHVPRPGRPLPTAGSAAAGLPPGPLPEPGMPVLVEGRVVAVSLDPLAGRLAGPAELGRLLAELKGR